MDVLDAQGAAAAARMRAALSAYPPTWHGVAAAAQAGGAAAADVRADVWFPTRALRFSYERAAPLHLAVLHGKAQLVELLLERGADVEARAGPGGGRRGGRTPLFLAVDAWQAGARCPRMVELLLRRGADVRTCDGSGNTLTTVAVLNRNYAALELLAAWAPGLVRATSFAGWSALREAAWRGDRAAGEVLRRHGAPVDDGYAGLAPVDLAREGMRILKRDALSLRATPLVLAT